MSKKEETILQRAQILWDYMKLGQPLRKSGCLLVMGSHDLRVAEYGAKLMLVGWAPLMVCSGGLGNFTKKIRDEPEAEKFVRVAEKMGVCREKILIENKSTNTGENVLFSRRLHKEKKFLPESMLLIHKPYMERRALATFKKIWPEMSARVSSPPILMKDYPNESISMDEMLKIMVGDFQRILIYPKKGFQVKQSVPKETMKAYDYLINEGFTHHLIGNDDQLHEYNEPQG